MSSNSFRCGFQSRQAEGSASIQYSIVFYNLDTSMISRERRMDNVLPWVSCHYP